MKKTKVERYARAIVLIFTVVYVRSSVLVTGSLQNRAYVQNISSLPETISTFNISEQDRISKIEELARSADSAIINGQAENANRAEIEGKNYRSRQVRRRHQKREVNTYLDNSGFEVKHAENIRNMIKNRLKAADQQSERYASLLKDKLMSIKKSQENAITTIDGEVTEIVMLSHHGKIKDIYPEQM